MTENPFPAEVATDKPIQWLPAPSPSHGGTESNRSLSPAGSDNVFASEVPEAAEQLVFRPPEGFADSPSSLLPTPTPALPPPPPPTPMEQAHQPDQDLVAAESGGAKRKRDSGRSKRAKSCTLPDVGGTTDEHPMSGSTQSLETRMGGEDSAASGRDGGGPNRAVSAAEMWYPETHLPPKRQLTVRARSEERERWNKPTRRSENWQIHDFMNSGGRGRVTLFIPCLGAECFVGNQR